jgi:hypothetical protein
VTDFQILTIALASVPNVLAVLLGVLINNSRISDLRADMVAFRTDVNGRLNNLEARLTNIDAKFDSRFDLLLGKLVEIDNRLTRVEPRRG